MTKSGVKANIRLTIATDPLVNQCLSVKEKHTILMKILFLGYFESTLAIFFGMYSKHFLCIDNMIVERATWRKTGL